MILEEIDGRYNIAPTTTVSVFTKDGWTKMRWGLVPSWSKEPKTKYATFNARVESFFEKPMYRSAWKSDQRCLIPVSGYYEWKTEDGGKHPFYIHSALDEPLVFAGLWEKWQNEDSELFSCTIITTAAKEILADLHHRMPVMFEPAEAELWLRGGKEDAMTALHNPSVQNVIYHQVDDMVGNPRNQGRTLISPCT